MLKEDQALANTRCFSAFTLHSLLDTLEDIRHINKVNFTISSSSSWLQ